jgi:hypothetical protein
MEASGGELGLLASKARTGHAELSTPSPGLWPLPWSSPEHVFIFQWTFVVLQHVLKGL